jgi:hypothetical protein
MLEQLVSNHDWLKFQQAFRLLAAKKICVLRLFQNDVLAGICQLNFHLLNTQNIRIDIVEMA